MTIFLEKKNLIKNIYITNYENTVLYLMIIQSLNRDIIMTIAVIFVEIMFHVYFVLLPITAILLFDI